jgi:hypothetical protein
VDWFFVMSWVENCCFGDFSLSKPLDTTGCLHHNIVSFFYLPKSVLLGFCSDH